MATKMKARMPLHKAILVNGDTIEYYGAHPTHWSTGGVDDKGQPNGSPVEVIPVMAYLPGKLPEDDWAFDEDPRDNEILKLREMILSLREQLGDKKDTDLEELRDMVEKIMTAKAEASTGTLTPEEEKANEDALADYKPGKSTE